jgi:hypothetical protein
MCRLLGLLSSSPREAAILIRCLILLQFCFGEYIVNQTILRFPKIKRPE